MAHDYDPGPVSDEFAALVHDYPGPEIYPADSFRVEWGPIFHRGRLDGSARLLVIGQDPAESEAVVRRILVGEAGHRTQGLMAKLGFDHSYLLINTFLYSVYGQGAGSCSRRSPTPTRPDRWSLTTRPSGGERIEIPELDLPAGLPAWMPSPSAWADRVGATAAAKRRNITITVPTGAV